MSRKKSKTTQNVTKGILVSAGPVAATLVFIRYMWPGLLPWDVEKDVMLDFFVATVIGPRVSRFIAMRKNPEKLMQWEKKEGEVTVIKRTKPEKG